MLLSFSVKNYGPFRDEATIDMTVGKGDELPDNAVPCSPAKTSVLTSAVVFGPNSSGKSRLFMAVNDLKQLVRQVPPPNSPIPWYNPFRLSNDTRGAPTEMSIVFSLDAVLYEYSISFDSSTIVSESLYESPKGRKSKVFERNGQDVILTGAREKELRQIASMTAPNAPMLTVAAQFNNRTCMDVHRYLMEMIVCIGDAPINMINQVIRDVSADPWMMEHMVKAMQIADFGITDIVGEASPVNPSEVPGLSQLLEALKLGQAGEAMKVRLEMRHDFPESDVDERSRHFPYTIESLGTLQMFSMMGPILRSLRDGGVVLFDEFASSLHNNIARWIVEQFQASNNPHGAQLIVNTHNLLLMDTVSLFRRDQIWFTDKDDTSGSATLYCLSDFTGIRKDMDILKSYVAGRFDAIPFVDRGDLL